MKLCRDYDIQPFHTNRAHDRVYKTAIRPTRPIIKPAPLTHDRADAATPLSLTGAVGEAVPLETVPLLLGWLVDTVPFFGALPAAVVCATRVVLSERSEEASAIVVTGAEEDSTIEVTEEVGSASEVEGRSVTGPSPDTEVV